MHQGYAATTGADYIQYMVSLYYIVIIKQDMHWICTGYILGYVRVVDCVQGYEATTGADYIQYMVSDYIIVVMIIYGGVYYIRW
jgi:predicted O-linked N-acetylglucosamine transferase (SPINDLY family)